MPEPDAKLKQQLTDIISSSAWFMDALAAVAALGLADWCIGAGAVRNLVWDHLHGRRTAGPSALSDIDVAYFELGELSAQRDHALQGRLHSLRPALPWEVTNQAGVHQWFEAHFGHAVEPLPSLHAAVASWPEFATAVGVYLDHQQALQIMAPHGLQDLFDMVVRRNPARVSLQTFHERVHSKRYLERWPGVKIVL